MTAGWGCVSPTTANESARGGHSVQPLLLWRVGPLRGRAMNDNRMTSAAAQECLKLANRCLIESSRTLDREAADTLRHLAQRYFKEADRHKDE
jgi:hypothetical protein